MPLDELGPTGTRRHFGTFYTPDAIAEIIAAWALRDVADRVLEPSFGDGAFLRAATKQLQKLGASEPAKQVFGVDVDRRAVESARHAFRSAPTSRELREADFLAVEALGDWAGFPAVIGNPPYVRHHNIERNTIADYRRQELGLPRAADLWCTFTMRSLAFLAKGGRLGFVLPTSFLFADYAAPVREALTRHFQRVTTIRLSFGVFAQAGAEEQGVVILCDGYQVAADRAPIHTEARSLAELEATVAEPTASKIRLVDFGGISTTLLGDIGKVSIGTVTGANRYFLIDNETVRAFGISRENLRPALSRTSQAKGLWFRDPEHSKAAVNGHRVWMLSPESLGPRGGGVRKYLATIPRTLRRGTYWFRKRECWYRPEIRPGVSAALTYMNHLGPRVIILGERFAVTNTFHEIRFREEHSVTHRLALAVSALTSVAQLSAERVGRSYGGGVLKLEPKEARNLLLPDVTAKTAARMAARAADIDRLLRFGLHSEAMDAADEACFGGGGSHYFRRVRRDALRELAELRRTRMRR